MRWFCYRVSDEEIRGLKTIDAKLKMKAATLEELGSVSTTGGKKVKDNLLWIHEPERMASHPLDIIYLAYFDYLARSINKLLRFCTKLAGSFKLPCSESAA